MIFRSFMRILPVFEPLPSSRDVGYVLKDWCGCGRVRERKGRPVIKETRQVCCGRCRNDNTFRDFYFATVELIFCDYRYFRKPSKHMVLTPTSPLLPDNHSSRRNMWFRRPHPSSFTTATTRAPYAVPSKLRL